MNLQARKLESLTLIRPAMGDFRSTDALPPLSMAILAARTPDDVSIRFYDDKIEKIPLDDKPDLVALTVETFTARRAYAIADSYRAKGVTVVMGGYHATFLPDEVLQHADAVVIGDAEGSWEQLLEDFKAGELKQTYTGGNERPLDDYRIDRSIFTDKKYPPVELVQFGRGCRFVCDFCSISTFYRESLRNRSVESLVAELKQLNTRKLVFFVDDNLFESRDTLEELLRAITPLKIRWTCQISIDVARDDNLLDLMAESGCVLALIGFESMNAENLKQMRKPWNRVAGDYKSVVQKFHARGIGIYGTFVFGYDHDTLATIEQSLEFALDARLEIANFNPLTPTPGSPLYDRLVQEGRMLSPRWWLDPQYQYGDPIFTPAAMPAAAFAQKCFDAKTRFYSWRSIFRRVFKIDFLSHGFRTWMVGLANIVSRREVRRKQSRILGT